ncbi:hypothetical protein, partial [Streptosporangium sp. NPDC048865]|uniref:hypothetical protein n=1 Tax=Streptosporangium sp. NPDC048865 TaxID=3155766 RepID=UPI00341B620D
FNRDDRPGGGYRGDRPGFNRDSRGGDRPPFNRDDRGSGRPSFNRDDRGERPSFNRDDRGGERRSYGDRDQTRSRYGSRPDGERRPFNRDDRPGGGYRGDRPSFNRDDRGGDRPSFNRDDRGERRPFDRDDRSGGGRPFGNRDGEGSRTRYGRDDRSGARDEAPGNQREELPELAPDITAEELDKEIREELRSLPLDLADLISRHLVAAERALGDDDAERAYEHTKVARRFAARIGVIREAVGIAAYRAGHFSEALSDLRAARRMTGSDSFLPIMADCERGLGRPERALDLVRSKEAERLDRIGKIELAIVESGARRDLGQNDAAVITLQRLPELRDPRPQPWSARLAFAYADALSVAGHEGPATEWFGRAMAFDEDGETDAAERYAELTGAVIEDLEEDEEDDEDGDIIGGDNRLSGADTDDDVHLDDDADIDDVAALDAEIEDEDDLFDDEFGVGDAPGDGSSDEEGSPENASSGDEAVGAERKAEKPGKVEHAVGPAFIEPDFGDILSDAPDADSDADDDLAEGRDEDEDKPGREHRGTPEKK